MNSVILLHSPLPVAGISIGMEMGCQQRDSLWRLGGSGNSNELLRALVEQGYSSRWRLPFCWHPLSVPIEAPAKRRGKCSRMTVSLMARLQRQGPVISSPLLPLSSRPFSRLDLSSLLLVSEAHARQQLCRGSMLTPWIVSWQGAFPDCGPRRGGCSCGRRRRQPRDALTRSVSRTEFKELACRLTRQG